MLAVLLLLSLIVYFVYNLMPVDKAADMLVAATLKVNGVSDGKISYSRVVKLLLQYYF